MTFTKKLLDVSFRLAPKDGRPTNFKGTSVDNIKLRGLRISARVVKSGGSTKSTAQINVYGMTFSQMNQLSTLGMLIRLIPSNTVTLEAGDEEEGMFIVFQGTITNAYADMQGAPNPAFRIDAHTGLAEDVINAKATSFKGATDVATIMQYLAKQMGYVFENNGVSVILSNPYLSGSYRSQALTAAKAANIDWIMDNGILAIWPKNGVRKSRAIVVAARTGMVGYPAYTSQGLMLKTQFNPAIQFGGKIKVESDLEPANGTWSVFTLDHDLESKVPNGRWFSTIGAYNPGAPPPVTR